MGNINEKLEKQTARYLNRMSRQEQRLRKQLSKLDSAEASRLFDGAQEKYAALSGKMKNITSKDAGVLKGQYLPYLDSAKGALKFLDKNKDLISSGKDISDHLSEVNKLQNSLNGSAEVTSFLRDRKAQIGEALKKCTSLPKGLSKEYGNFNKNVYYYGAQVKEYKELLNDPSRMEQKALELLNKLPAFNAFMKQHSLLSGLFNIPANYGSPEALAGLQTRAQVQQQINSQIGRGGPNAQTMLEQNLQGAQSQLTQLKNKIAKSGGDGNDMDMPDFKPNDQKTKSFFSRVELGSNFQTVKGNNFFPVTSDLALSAGYKLNDKSILGIGGSYKLGMGKDIRNISFSSQGMGLRSFVDYKLKGNFWLSGGAEMNYRTQFDNFQVLKDHSAWQQSALIGFSRKYQLSKKTKGNAQILYDALWRKQVPRGQPVVFRTGFNFK